MFGYFLLTFIPLGIGYYNLYKKLEACHISIFQLNRKLNYYLAYQYYLPNAVESIEPIEKNNIINLCNNSDVIISNSTNNYINSNNNYINSTNNYINCIDCDPYNICEKCKLLNENKIYLIL